MRKVDPRVRAAHKELTEQHIKKIGQEIRNNRRKAEQIAFSQGILFTVVITWLGMAVTYAMGNTPNPGNLLGCFILGLYYRYGKET